LRQVNVPFSYLLLGALAVACLVALAFAIGMRYGPERLPATEKHPTFNEIHSGGVAPGLVAPGPSQPAPAGGPAPSPRPGGTAPAPRPGGVAPAPGPAAKSPAPAPRPASGAPPGGAAETPRPAGPEKPVVTETPTGPQFRVRIARLGVSQPDAIDKMRTFLSQKGIETELDTRAGYYVLYSRDRFPDKRKSDECAAQINKQLDAFEKATRIPTSKDAYSIQVTKE
jgi:hypothetical protein